MTRAGFVALAGRPNVGKSTFLNVVVGGKVAIVSDRPQTTRRALRGVLTRGETQVVFVDLPGVQRPRDLLTERMASTVEAELAGADAALLILNGEQSPGPGDRFIAERLGRASVNVTIAVNKVDRLGGERTAKALLDATALLPECEVFPLSARTGEGIEPLLAHLGTLMPEGPLLYSGEQRSDQPQQLLLAELVREAVIRRTFDELPHAVEVVVEELEQPREGLFRVGALIWVETESQKRIVIGAGGSMVKAIGVAARKQIERELDSQVHLELVVRVRRDWRGEPALLDRLGIG
ncbi:MAG TPA: GTPase Era [Solirubrobacteraceae bacterium]